MEAERKVRCYQNAYQLLSKKKELKKLGRPAEQNDYTLNCTVGGAKAQYKLRADVDLLMLRAEIYCPGKTHDELMSFGEQLTKSLEGVNTTEYDEKLIITDRVILGNIDENVAEKLSLDRTEQFFSSLIENEEIIREYTKSISEEKKESEEEKGNAKPEPSLKGKDLSESNLQHTEHSKTEPKENELKKSSNAEKTPKEHHLKMKNLFAVDNGVTIPDKSTEKNSTKKGKEDFTDKSTAKSDFKKEKEDFKNYRESQMQFLKKRKDKLEEEEAELKQRKEELEKQQDDLKKAAASLSQEKEKLSANQDYWAKESARVSAEREALSHDIEMWNTMNTDERQIARREELSKMEEEFYKEKEQFGKFQNDTLDDLAQRMDAIQADEEKIRESKKKTEEKESELLMLEQSLSEREGTIKKKESELAEQKKMILDKESDIRRANILIQDAERKKKQVDIIQKNLEHEKSVLKSDKERLLKKEEELRDLEKLQEELSEKEKLLEQKINKERSILNNTDQIREEQERNKTRILELTKELSGYKNQCTELEKEKISLSKELETVKNEFSSIQRKLNDKENKNKELLREKESLDDKILELQGDLFDAREQLNEISETQPSDVFLKKEMTEKEKQVRELTEKLEKISGQYKQIKDSYNLSLQENNSLQEKYHEAVSESKRFSEKIEELEARELELTVNEEKSRPKFSLEDMNQAGIPLSPIIGESELIFQGTIKPGITILVDSEVDMIQITRELRKRPRNIKQITEWNNKDITVLYALEGKELICRKCIKHDYITETKQIIDKIMEV